MKPLRVFAGLLFFLLIVCTLALLAWMQKHHLVLATPNTESAFLQNYDPVPAVDLYKTQANEWWSNEKTAGAAAGYAHHQRDFHGEVAILGNDLMPLANALSEDVLEQLSRNGAKILDQSTSAEHGYHYSYQSGNTLGEVIVAPPHLSNSTSRLVRGSTRVAIDIYLDEKWFPPKKG